MSKTFLMIIMLTLGFLFSDPFESLDIDFLKKNKQQKSIPIKPSPPKQKGDLPSYDKVIEDLEIIEGLFELYWDQEKNKFIMSIHPDQFDKVHLANLTRKSGDGMYYDSGSMLWEFPFVFHRLANIVQFVHINTDFRADKASSIH